MLFEQPSELELVEYVSRPYDIPCYSRFSADEMMLEHDESHVPSIKIILGFGDVQDNRAVGIRDGDCIFFSVGYYIGIDCIDADQTAIR